MEPPGQRDADRQVEEEEEDGDSDDESDASTASWSSSPAQEERAGPSSGLAETGQEDGESPSPPVPPSGPHPGREGGGSPDGAIPPPGLEPARCTACDRPGCSRENRGCAFYRRPRDAHEDAQLGDHVPHFAQMRVVVAGRRFRLGEQLYDRGVATGAGNNCLIDTLRQALGVPCDMDFVRAELMRRFPAGPARVTERSFLDLRDHWESVLTCMSISYQAMGHAPIDVATLKIACVDADFPENGDVVGTGARHLHILRENQNHFVPLVAVESGSAPAAAQPVRGGRTCDEAPLPEMPPKKRLRGKCSINPRSHWS